LYVAIIYSLREEVEGDMASYVLILISSLLWINIFFLIFVVLSNFSVIKEPDSKPNIQALEKEYSF
jgi:hypothetical protein